jgi:acyl carrier protein
MTDIYHKLTEVFRDVFDDDGLCLCDQTTADDVDGWDSLNHIRLMLAIQKTFGVRFSAHEIGKLKNVGDLASLLQSKA